MIDVIKKQINIQLIIINITMAFKAKKLLMILEMNQTLLHIRNFRSKIKDFQAESYKIKYDDQLDNFGFLYRNGKAELLQYLFYLEKPNIDVAVWSCLDSKLTQHICQKYFGRYYRDLLFVLPTNRGLYTTHANEPQDNIQIPRQLSTVFAKFPLYNSTNTLMLTTLGNKIMEHTKNDLIIHPFGPKYPTFQNDIGCYSLGKYLKGIMARLGTSQLNDVTKINSGKPLHILNKRYSHRMFSDIEYR